MPRNHRRCQGIGIGTINVRLASTTFASTIARPSSRPSSSPISAQCLYFTERIQWRSESTYVPSRITPSAIPLGSSAPSRHVPQPWSVASPGPTESPQRRQYVAALGSSGDQLESAMALLGGGKVQPTTSSLTASSHHSKRGITVISRFPNRRTTSTYQEA